MDYIKIPRHLIYKERTDLNDFGVRVPGTINHVLLSNLKELFKATDRAKELILRCFNNAYYICTIIPFDDDPELQVAEYEKLLLKDDNHYDLEEVVAVSMAMVNKLLPACSARWRPENSELTSTIRYRFTHYQWMNMGASNSFMFIDGKNNTDALTLPPGEFEPRDIIEVIDNSTINNLQLYAEFICERLANLEDPHQRLYGADLAIARIRDYQRELCEDNEYNPKIDSFVYADNPSFIRDFTMEERVRQFYQESKEAIDYYKEHYPPTEENNSNDKTVETPQTSGTVVLQATTSEQEKLLQQATDVNTQQAAKYEKTIKELEQQLAKSEEIIKQMQERIDDYEARYDPEDINHKKVIAMSGRQHVILFLSVLAEHGKIPNARTNLSRLMAYIAARKEKTMIEYLKDGITKEQCDKLANEFNEDCPFIANLIRELPDKLKKDKAEKNRAKALKKDK